MAAKSSHLKDTGRLLAMFARKYPGATAIALALLLVAGLAEGVGVLTLLPLFAMASGQGVDGASGVQETVNDALLSVGLQPNLPLLLCIVVGGVLLKAVLVLIANTHVGYTATRMMTELRLELIRALMGARWSYFVKQPAGILSNALGYEAKLASSTYQSATKLITESLQVLIYGVVALFTHWQVTAAGALFGMILFALLHKLVEISHTAGRRNVEFMRNLSSRLNDGLNAIKPIKAMAQEDKLLPLLVAETYAVNQTHRREIFSSAMFGSMVEPMLTVFLATGVYVVLTIAKLPFSEVLFMAVLFQRMVTRISTVQGTYQGLASSQGAYWSLTGLIERTKEAREQLIGRQRPAGFDRVCFEQVSFNYGEGAVLRKATFEIERGKATAIIGPSGAGKTTIIDLLTGFHVATKGVVRIGATPIEDVDLHWWRQQLGYVPQDTVMFNDTIRSNITLGDTFVSLDAITEALAAAGLSEFIGSLPDGLDTIVGERGARLSGGQRQRLAIARALIRKPALLILDEATSSLDPQTETEILTSIGTLAGKVTVVAISHQPAVLQIVDNVYKIDRGTITKMKKRSKEADAPALPATH